ncbi:MAG: ABC transporter permease, partial [Verrucomicrobiota bacterium]
MKRSRIKGFLIDLDESARIAAEQLREHKVRSLLTALGVIIGVWAVVLIGLGINGLDSVFQNSLKILGSDHYYVQKFPWRDPGDKMREYVNRRDIKESYADEINDAIAESPQSLLQLAVPVYRFRRGISRNDISVSDIEVSASWAEYAYITTASIAHGRFFTKEEEMGGQKLVILGSGLASALFPEEDNWGTAVGKEIKIDRIDFRVIAVLEQQGSFLGVGEND